MRRLLLTAMLTVVALGGSAHAQPAATSTEVVREFFDAFSNADAKAYERDMATLERLYAPDVKWKDTIFRFDDRAGTMGMWRILLARGADSKFSYRILSTDGDKVTVNWLADYKVFGRPVHNDVMATLVVRNGRIVAHEDVYSWEKWARQAFPLGGVSNIFPVKQIIMGGLNLFLKARIFIASFGAAREASREQAKDEARESKAPGQDRAPRQVSETRGLNGALERERGGVRR